MCARAAIAICALPIKKIIVNTKLGKCAESNTTKNTSKVLTLPRKEKRYDTDKKYILNQAYQV